MSGLRDDGLMTWRHHLIVTKLAMDAVKPAGIWVPAITEDRRNYTPQAGFEAKLQRKIKKARWLDHAAVTSAARASA